MLVFRVDESMDFFLAYDQDDGASTEEITVETFVDDPARSVNIEGSENLLIGASVRRGE